MKKTIVFFDVYGKESRRVEIPQFYVTTRIDYAYTLWKYNQFRKKNPTLFDSWDTVNEPDNAVNN